MDDPQGHEGIQNSDNTVVETGDFVLYETACTCVILACVCILTTTIVLCRPRMFVVTL